MRDGGSIRSEPGPPGEDTGLPWIARHNEVPVTVGHMGGYTMIRITVCTIATLLGIAAVAAQSDPIAARRALMKANGDQAKIGVDMAKGQAPFDLAKAKAMFATFVDAANKMPNLFPENSKVGGDTAATPKVWEDMADFKARFTKFGEHSAAAIGAVKDLKSFKEQFTIVGKDCGGCHEIYRVKKT